MPASQFRTKEGTSTEQLGEGKVFSGDSDSKESACSAGDPGLIPGLRRSPEAEHDNPL